jgi:predicted metal-dependent hydrolase
MHAGKHHQIKLRGRRVNCRLVRSRSARKLRVRVGINGVEVVQPANRTDEDLSIFLGRNDDWILDQLQRAERLRKIRIADRPEGEIFFRGEYTPIRIERTAAKSRGNLVRLVDKEIVVQRPLGSRTPIARSLENWFRREARAEIRKQLEMITRRLRQQPRRVYVLAPEMPLASEAIEASRRPPDLSGLQALLQDGRARPRPFRRPGGGGRGGASGGWGSREIGGSTPCKADCPCTAAHDAAREAIRLRKTLGYMPR